jgi:uncharacterized repeat protein (TIGR03803 family)
VLAATITHYSVGAPLPLGGQFACGGGYLWLNSNVDGTTDTFEELNATTGVLAATITHYSVGAPLPLGGKFAYGGGYLWLYSNVNGTTDTFEELNATTGALVATITHYSVGAPLPLGGQFSYGGGYLWLNSNVNGTTDTFEELNATTGALVATITHYSVGAPLPLGGKFSFNSTPTATATTTSVTSSNGSSTYGQAVTFTATVTPTSGSGETGTVQFQIDGSNVGSPVNLSGNTASYTTSALTAASHSIVAVYSGDSSFSGSTSPAFTQNVAKATTASAVTSSNGSSSFGQSVTFTAAVTPVSGETGTVQFQIDGSDVGSPVALSGNTATLTISTLSAGSHSIAAIYGGDGNFATSTSPAITQNVAKMASWAANTVATFNGTNGEDPTGVVLDSFGNIFGATQEGGNLSLGNGFGDGTVFEVACGSGTITTLATLNGANGANPAGSLVLDSSGNLFGATYGGGANGDGTVFEIAYGSSVITTLASFNGTNGQYPQNAVLDPYGNLFGTTEYGGANGDGTVFEVAYKAGVINTVASFNGTNGINPGSVVLDSSDNIIGTTFGAPPVRPAASSDGIASGDGTVFEIAHGSGIITTLASFNGANGCNPSGVVVLDSSGDLFGTTENGAGGWGTVFELARGSGVVTNLASFNGTNGYGPRGVAMDSSGNIFGATNGTSGVPEVPRYWYSTVFEIAKGSGAITTLASYSYTGTGLGVAVDSFAFGKLFGTTSSGGANGDGTVFQFAGAYVIGVTSTNTSPIYGQAVTFTTTLNSNAGVAPTGTVQFQIDGSDVGSPVPVSVDTASYTTSTLDAGAHSVVAIYSGDNNFVGTTSPAFTQNVGPAVLTIGANAVNIKLAADGQHVDVWNNAAATGTPDQCLPCCDIYDVTYAGPAGGDLVVIDYSNGDPLPAGGISLTGGAGQNKLEIVGDPAGDNDTVAINGGSFVLPANTRGAGVMNVTLGTVSIAAGASLALGQSDSQADQTVLAVNNLSVAGTLDVANNTLLANETNVSVSQVATWVQNAGVGASIFSSLVTGPDSQASRAVGYGDWNEDPLSVPAGDVEVKYVPFGDTNLDGTVDITDLTRAINNLGLSPGYYGGDVANQGMVNITDIADIINDLGAQLNASGDGANAAGVSAGSAAVKPAGGTVAAVVPPADGSIGSLFSDSRIQSDWLESQGSVLGD